MEDYETHKVKRREKAEDNSVSFTIHKCTVSASDTVQGFIHRGFMGKGVQAGCQCNVLSKQLSSAERWKLSPFFIASTVPHWAVLIALYSTTTTFLIYNFSVI